MASPGVQEGRCQHHRHVLQPQLPRAQRRQPEHDELHREPGDRHGLRACGEAVVQPAHGLVGGRRRQALQARRAGRGARGAARRLREPGLRIRAARRGRQLHRDRRRPEERPPPAAHALPRVGRQRPRGPPDPRQGEGQVHDRPHLAGRALAPLPRPSQPALGQHLLGGGQRVHRRDRRGAEPGHQGAWAVPEDRPLLQRPRPWLGRHRRPQLRRGLEPRARRDVATAARRQGHHHAQLRAHRRDEPQEAGRAGADLRGPGRLRPGVGDGHDQHHGPGRSGAWLAGQRDAAPR